MAYATAQDVQDRYEQDLDERLTALVTTRLGDAELLIKHKIPDLDDRISDPEHPNHLDEAVVVLVESEMVLRLIRNPEGLSQESDGNYSYAIYQQVASGKLEITDDEWALLGLSDGRMFVIAPTLPIPVYGPPADFDPSLAWGLNVPGQDYLIDGSYP
jgi:hypothetical protein